MATAAARKLKAVENRPQLFIGGKWVDPAHGESDPVIDPATGEVIGRVAVGTKIDAERAIRAAQKAYETLVQNYKSSAFVEKASAALEALKKSLLHQAFAGQL